MAQYNIQSKNIPNFTFAKYFELIKKIEALETENELLIHERDTLKNEKEGFLSSRSWRITKPLRAFTNFFRHLNMQKKKTIKTLSDAIKIKEAEKKLQKNKVFPKQIKFSIITLLHNTPKEHLAAMIKSVISQTYTNWELLLIDESEDKYTETICKSYNKKFSNIKYIRLNKEQKDSENIFNSLGDYTGILNYNALLHPSALFELMNVISDDNADFIYTDEAEYSSKNIIFRNHKPDFALDTLRSCNYIGHFSVFSKDLIKKADVSVSEIHTIHYYDLILRLTDAASTDVASKIKHIPKLLYFTNNNYKTSALSINDEIISNKKAILSSLKRHNISADIECTEINNSIYRLKYELTEKPLVSIIILNKDNIYILDKCLRSILEKTTYDNFEILIVENNSIEDETFAYYEELKIYNNIQILYWKEKGFNYSELNNFAYQYTKGKHLIFLNNDIEIITPNWIEEMLMYSQREDVGAVGIKLYYPDNSIQHAGISLGTEDQAYHLYYGAEGDSEGYMGNLKFVQNLSAVTGACIIIKKKIFEESGLFSLEFPCSFNDVDFCLKVRSIGYLIVWTPFAEAYHFESKTRGYIDNDEKLNIHVKDAVRFWSKWKKFIYSGDPYYNCNLSMGNANYTLR